MYIHRALQPAAAASIVPPEHILNSAVDTYNLRIDNSVGRRHALARGGPRGQPRSTAVLSSDADAKMLLKDPTSGPSLASHNILRGMMQNMSLIMHSEDTRHAPLAELNRGLEAWLLTPVDTNMYMTPYKTAVSAFGLHQDNMDVIIVQVAGKKTWSVYPTIFRSPDGGHTLPELFQAPLNQDKVLSHVASVHRNRADSSIRAVHQQQDNLRGDAGKIAAASSSFLAGTVSGTFAQGSKPFVVQDKNSADTSQWVKLPINITMSPGDVLYIPHGTPHAAMPVSGDTPPGINDRKWDAKMERVLHERTNASSTAMDHSSSLAHHLTVGLLYTRQRLIHLLETAMEVCVRRRLLSVETRDAVNMATRYLRQEEEDVLAMGGASTDTLNVYGNASAGSFMGQVLHDDMRTAVYSQDALPALLRSVVYTNVLAPRSMFPAFHPCHPRRTFFFEPGHSQPHSVKVDMACSVVSYGADSTPELWKEWSKDEVRVAARELEDLVAATKRKAQHRWAHAVVALHNLLADSGATGAASALSKLFGFGSLTNRAKAGAAATSVDGMLARATCGDSAVFDTTELATNVAHSWLAERSSFTQAQSSNFGRLVTPAQLDEASGRLASMEAVPHQYSPGQLRRARIAVRTPEFWDEQFPQPAFVMDAGQINVGSAVAASLSGSDDAQSVLQDLAAENAGVSPIAAARQKSTVRHDTTLFRRRSDVPAMMVGSLPEHRNERMDETVLNSYYTRFFGSHSPMLREAGLTTEHMFGTIDAPASAHANSSIAHAATVSTSANLCVGGRKKLQRLDSLFHTDDSSSGEGAVPMLAIYNADVLRFRSPEVAAAAQAMVSYPPGIPFTPLDACVEGLVQMRRQDAAFFATHPESSDSDTSPGALLHDWNTCNGMNSTLSALASLLAKLNAVVLDSGTAPLVYATFSLSEHRGQRLRSDSTANSVKRVNARIRKRYGWAPHVGALLGIEVPSGGRPSLERFLVSNSTRSTPSQPRGPPSPNHSSHKEVYEEPIVGALDGVGDISWEAVQAARSSLRKSGII